MRLKNAGEFDGRGGSLDALRDSKKVSVVVCDWPRRPSWNASDVTSPISAINANSVIQAAAIRHIVPKTNHAFGAPQTHWSSSTSPQITTKAISEVSFPKRRNRRRTFCAGDNKTIKPASFSASVGRPVPIYRQDFFKASWRTGAFNGIAGNTLNLVPTSRA